MGFSRTMAAYRRGRRSFAARGVVRALAAGDWASVAQCRSVLADIDAEAACGVAIRAHMPLADQEVPAAVHAAQVGKLGATTGLCEVMMTDGLVLREPKQVKAEISSYFQTLFHGMHGAAVGAAEPHNTGRTFVPDKSLLPGLLAGLPTLPLMMLLPWKPPSLWLSWRWR